MIGALILGILAGFIGKALMPGKDPAAPVSLGGESLPFTITSASKNPDVAAAYIDFITSSQAADVVAGKGDLPAAPLATSTVVDPQTSLGEIIQGFNDKSKAGLLTPYLDWASPTMGDTIHLAPRPGHLHMFSPSSGLRLAD